MAKTTMSSTDAARPAVTVVRSRRAERRRAALTGEPARESAVSEPTPALPELTTARIGDDDPATAPTKRARTSARRGKK